MKFCLSIPNTINYPFDRLNHFVKKSQNTQIYFKYMIQRVIRTFINYIELFLLIIIELIIIIYNFFKNKKIEWLLLFCILFVIGQLTSIILIVGQFSSKITGEIDDVNRLLMASYPFIILIAASFIESSLKTLNHFYIKFSY